MPSASRGAGGIGLGRQPRHRVDLGRGGCSADDRAQQPEGEAHGRRLPPLLTPAARPRIRGYEASRPDRRHRCLAASRPHRDLGAGPGCSFSSSRAICAPGSGPAVERRRPGRARGGRSIPRPPGPLGDSPAVSAVPGRGASARRVAARPPRLPGALSAALRVPRSASRDTAQPGLLLWQHLVSHRHAGRSGPWISSKR